MLIKNKNIGLKTTVFILTVLILAFFTLNFEKFKIEKEDIIQYLMSMNLGLSTRHNLVDIGQEEFHSGVDNRFSEYRKLRLKSLVESIPEIIKYKTTSDNFERVEININYTDLQKIMLDRNRAIKDKLLSNPATVNANLEFMGKTYKAKLRLKGDLSDHWLSKYRMSFRIELKGENTILKFKKFSLQKPHVRNYPHDYVFQSLMRDIGNISPAHNFVHAYVNGVDWGIMNMEEHMSKELLEKQNRKNSVIVRFSNEDSWLYSAKSKNPYAAYRLSDPSLYVHLYGSKKYLKDYHNRKMYSYILKQHKNNNSHHYDINSYAKSYIMSTIWGHWHALKNQNSRHYFNPYTLKLEQITTDAGVFNKLTNIPPKLPVYLLNVIKSESYNKNVDISLEKIKNTISNIDKHMSYAQSLFPVDKQKSTKIIKDNMEKILNDKEYYLTTLQKEWKHYINNNVSSQELTMPTKQQASEFKEHLHIRHYTDGTLELHKLIPDNVIIKDVLYNGLPISIEDTAVPSYLSDQKPTIIKTPYKGIQDDMFTVNTEYQGFNRSIKNDITLVSDGIGNPLLLDTAGEFDFINKLDSNTFEIKQGSWSIDKPIIVNGDLHILPGVNLQFSKDAYIIVKGSLTAIGGEANPIILKAISDSWKGIYVLNADKKSHLKNVNISNLSALEDELLKLTGGVTFYKSDVNFENVKIDDVKAEDALNIVESKFSLSSVYINNTVSDGLDSDFSKGNVSNSQFSNIGGDALDFSGSNISIETTETNNIKDKAVSAGEKSTLTIKNSTFNKIGVGVASKDGSSVIMSNTAISNYALYGAMTYLKKDFYDMPNLAINNSSVSNGRAYIRQTGTSMTVDGVDIPETKISVKKLYKTKVMAK